MKEKREKNAASTFQKKKNRHKNYLKFVCRVDTLLVNFFPFFLLLTELLEKKH